MKCFPEKEDYEIQTKFVERPKQKRSMLNHVEVPATIGSVRVLVKILYTEQLGTKNPLYFLHS